MKNLMFILCLVSLGLMACQPQRNREGVNIQNGARVGGNGVVPGSGGGINFSGQKPWGEITGANLQAAAQQLVGSTVQVGRIGVTQNSGAFFQGDVFSANGQPILQALQQGGAQIAPQSTLDLEIWDEFVTQDVPPIVIRMRPEFGSQASGTISAQGMRIVFQDQYGQIIIQGAVTGQQIQGQVSFTSAGQGEMPLGQFNAHICALFRCQ